MERAARNVDVFCSPSQFSVDKHLEFGFSRELKVLPNFLPDREPPVKEEAPPEPDRDPPYFLFVGRLEKIKGLQDMIPLFADDAPADLWIAGSGEYEGELRRLARGRPRVRFLGFQSSERLPEFYSRALALVVPSACYEVFPTVVLEAFREGTPVLARRLGPFPEMIERTEAGLLFNGHPDLRDALGRYFGLIRQVAERRGIQHVLDVLDTAPATEAGSHRVRTA